MKPGATKGARVTSLGAISALQPAGGPEASEASVFEARARALGLPFAPIIPGNAFVSADVAGVRAGCVAMAAEGNRLTYIAPDQDGVAKVAQRLRRHPDARSRLAVSTPTAIRAALRRAVGDEEGRAAVSYLADHFPEFSARRVFTWPQAVVGLLVFAGVLFAAVTGPLETLAVVNAIGAVFFLGVSALRFVAAAMTNRRLRKRARPADPPRAADDTLPVYTLLVPLFREASIVGDLVAALDLIDWPRDKLDIKMLLEADDAATVAAARAAANGPPYDLVIVPPIGPRTKPKALAYGLAFARGEFLTVYDAEDRPHPAQLRSAHARFAAAPSDLGCLQAPLVVDNARDSWLALSFAIEYAALFDGLLPALAKLRLPLPLGGTSNHFRTDALVAVGAWDPYNVTEDADLGIRLARRGYRAETLDLPTLEEAPARFLPWVRQRTRWFKGWLQTWLVHTRHPLRLMRELGFRGFLGFNLIGTGIVVSSMIYPLYLVSLVSMLTDPAGIFGAHGAVAATVKGLNVFNLCAGYLAMVLLAGRALRAPRPRRRDQRPHLPAALLVPHVDRELPRTLAAHPPPASLGKDAAPPPSGRLPSRPALGWSAGGICQTRRRENNYVHAWIAPVTRRVSHARPPVGFRLARTRAVRVLADGGASAARICRTRRSYRLFLPRFLRGGEGNRYGVDRLRHRHLAGRRPRGLLRRRNFHPAEGLSRPALR